MGRSFDPARAATIVRRNNPLATTFQPPPERLQHSGQRHDWSEFLFGEVYMGHRFCRICSQNGSAPIFPKIKSLPIARDRGSEGVRTFGGAALRATGSTRAQKEWREALATTSSCGPERSRPIGTRLSDSPVGTHGRMITLVPTLDCSNRTSMSSSFNAMQPFVQSTADWKLPSHPIPFFNPWIMIELPGSQRSALDAARSSESG